jgi:hypothetical protein
VFSNLEGIDKIAFFAFSVYRWLSEDRHANLDTHPHKDVFYEFAEMVKDDTNFNKSLLKYDGEDLRFFGTITSNDTTYSGGSNNTIAYKKTAEYLRNKFNTPLTKNKTFTNKKDVVISNSDKVQNPNKTGCLLPILIILIIVMLLK